MPLLTLGYTALVLIVLGSAVVAVFSQNLLRAAVALGLGSASLATIYFLLDARYAGAFELSVGAGLISVLFIIAISLTESVGGRREP
jgi:NADH-quinone oxidoreductase subunit J